MLIPRPILFLLGLVAWGTLVFELSVDTHRAVAEFGGLAPWSAPAFARQRIADLALLFGLATGLPAVGFFSDRLGRCRLLLGCLLLGPGFSALGALSISVFDFLVLRFLTGAALGGLIVAVVTLQFEGRKILGRSFAMAVVPALLIVLAAIRLPLPEIDWRLAMTATALPAVSVLFFRRFHDEPRAWKTAVRDVLPEESNRRREPFRRLFAVGRRRRLVRGILFSLALAAVTFGLMRVGRDCLRRSIRFESASRDFQREARLEDGAFLAFLLRYPQLLDTREINETDLVPVPEMLTPSPDDLARCLFEGILLLHEQKRPIDRDAAIDHALGCWNVRYGNGRQAEAIPSGEIERLWREAERILERGETTLAEKDLLPQEDRGEISGANLWEHRKTVMKTLCGEVRERHRERIESERGELAGFGFRFLYGGFFGLLLWRVALPRFGLRKVCRGFGAASLIVASGFLFFAPSPEVTEYAGLTLFVFVLGFVAIPYVVTLCVLVPAWFPCEIRSTGTGLSLAVGLVIVLLLSGGPASPFSTVSLLVCLTLGLVFSMPESKPCRIP